MNFSIIAAQDKNRGIGIKNRLPWNLKADMNHFTKITTAAAPGKINAVIMGKNTWESLPEKFRPLPDRLNVVLYSESEYQVPDDVLLFKTFDEALIALDGLENIDQIFVIGGARLYASTINHPKCEKIYLTQIDQEFEVDTYFPEILDDFRLLEETASREENGIRFKFMIYQKKI